MADPFSGVGNPSTAAIKDLVNKQFPGAFPFESIGGGGYHATGNAVDFSNGGDTGTPEMDTLAGWIASNYGTSTLELIHVNKDGTTVEYKMGVKEPTGWYGQATLAGHRNHVHWAITGAGLAAAGSPSPSGGSASGTNASLLSDWIGSAVKSIFQPLINYLIDAGMVMGGGILVLLGFIVIAKQTKTGAGLVKAGQQAGLAVATRGVVR